MAFKFILGRHMKTILNTTEEKQKKDIKDYVGGHLNESVLLRETIALPHKSWASANKDTIHLTKPVKTSNKSRVSKEKTSQQDALYDFVLGPSGVLPRGPCSSSRTPEIRYRIITESELQAEKKNEPQSKTLKSQYSELEDGVLVEELPPYELRILDHHNHMRDPVLDVGAYQQSLAGDRMLASQTSFLSRRSKPESLTLCMNSALSVHNQGITKRDQYRKRKAFDLAVQQKKEVSEKRKILSGQITAQHHEQKLQQELQYLSLSDAIPNLCHLQACSDVLSDIMKESPSLSYILHYIKTEYDNYILKLLDDKTAQKHYLRNQVDQMIILGTSRPNEMAAATERLKSLEIEARHLLDMNQRLRENVKTEQEYLNKTPEVPVKKKSVTLGHTVKEQPVELFTELENMKALILEKLDELNALRLKTRAEHVPATVCTHLEQCIKETEVEVQKLLKQNEYFERSIAEMEADLKEAITEADTSEKDARRIWHKVNSTRGMPGAQQGGGAESDEDDESKWNWYIS